MTRKKLTAEEIIDRELRVWLPNLKDADNPTQFAIDNTYKAIRNNLAKNIVTQLRKEGYLYLLKK